MVGEDGMRRKGKLTMAIAYSLIGTFMVLGGSYALFTSQASNESTLTVSTVRIDVWNGDSCGAEPRDKEKRVRGIRFDHLFPGVSKTSELTIKNTGTLDEWVGLEHNIPRNIPLQVKYTIEVYKSSHHDGDYGDPDANGDFHSNCHKGSKEKGAGGDDKRENDNLPVYTVKRDWFSTSDTTPRTPFKLSVGEYAVVSYTFQLPAGTPKKYQDQTGLLGVDVFAVQIRNNEGPNGPIQW